MKEFISDILNASMMNLRTSWRWIRSDFADEFRALDGSPALDEKGGVSERIWTTRTKYVLKVKSPTGRLLAFKTYRMLPGFRHIWQASPVAQEATNYQTLELLGIPMARVLAVGEIRHFFWLTGAFFMTEFAIGYENGKCFAIRGNRQEEKELRDEYLTRHLGYLAVLHDAGFYHRGFTPGNLLWKELPAPDAAGRMMDIKWIDVATCRHYSESRMKKLAPVDLGNLFRFFNLTSEERRAFTCGYYNACKIKRMDCETLCAKVEAATSDRLEKRGT